MELKGKFLSFPEKLFDRNIRKFYLGMHEEDEDRVIIFDELESNSFDNFYVLYFGNIIVAFLIFRVKQDYINIRKIMILETKSIKKLIKICLEDFKNFFHRKLRLMVDETSSSIVKLYQSVGLQKSKWRDPDFSSNYRGMKYF